MTEQRALSLSLSRRIMDEKETSGGRIQMPVRKMDKGTAELRSSRLANGDTYEFWKSVQYRLMFFFPN